MVKREILYVSNPGCHDVLCGRGAKVNNHEGNVLFRNLVKGNKMRYIAARKTDKPNVAREVVNIWKNQTPPGRFLMKTSSDNEASDSWYVIDDGKAREKVSQCLRERTPEVMSFVRKIQSSRKKDKIIITDKGDSSSEKVTVDEGTVPVDSKDSNSSASKHAPSGSNLSSHDLLQSWQLYQRQRINMDFPTVNNPFVHLTTQMSSGGISYGLQNLLLLQKLNPASQVPALKHSLALPKEQGIKNNVSNVSFKSPILEPSGSTASSMNPSNLINSVVAQHPYALNCAVLSSNSQVLNGPQAYQSFLNNFGSYQ